MKVLLIGYGKIAKIHAKYLIKNKVTWNWYDPYVEGGLTSLDSLQEFDNVFILTPEHTHYKIYKMIRELGYNKKIFLEKPAVLDPAHYDIFEDTKLFVGLVERYNPAVIALKNKIDTKKVLNIDFSRCCVAEHSSDVSILEDIGIHDIDLYTHLTGSKKKLDKFSCNIYNTGLTYIATVHDNIIVRFIWSKDTFFKERKIIVRQNDCTYEADLQEQSLVKHYHFQGKVVSENIYVEKSSPIENEQNYFFSNDEFTEDSKHSHEILDYMSKMISEHSIIDSGATIGDETDVWHFTHVRSTATIGSGTTIGSHCYIDSQVSIGDNCKVQSGCLLYHPAKIGNGVFIGPGVRLLNDKYPKAVDNQGNKLTDSDWNCERVVIKDRANIGAGCTILPGVTIGEDCLIGAGSVVTKDIPAGSVAYGNPAVIKDSDLK